MFYQTTSRIPALRNSLQGMRQINRIFDEALGAYVNGADADGTLASAWVPPCDVFEDKETLTIMMEIPGVLASDVKVSLENQRLTVRGEKRQVVEEQADRLHRYERAYGSFERTFTLPATVDAEQIEAKVEHGVLTLRLPKVEKARPREIPVMTSAQ